MSKAQLAVEEQRTVEYEEQLLAVRQEATKQSRFRYERSIVQDQVKKELSEHQSATATLQAESAKRVSTIAQLRREKQSLELEIEESDQAFKAETAALKAAQASKQRLDIVRVKLSAVREELRLLSGPAAKKAALDAAGADLPTDVVPAPTEEVPPPDDSVDMEALWLESGADERSVPQVPVELRPSLQSQAALEALYRSLLVRAGELREGLRQWGFAQSTTERTKDLSASLARNVRDNGAEAASLRNEQDKLTHEFKADKESFETMRGKVDQLGQRHQETQTQLKNAAADTMRLEERRDIDQRKLDEVVIMCGKLKTAHNEAEDLLDKHYGEIAAHPAEADRRTAAAARLAERAREQVRKTEADVAQTQQEFTSFKQAFEVLKEAHEALKQDLETERETYEQLKEEHENLNNDLNALARHYLDLLPKGLPGIDPVIGNLAKGEPIVEVS